MALLPPSTKTKQVIVCRQALVLNQVDAIMLIEALERPAMPIGKLKKASERYANNARLPGNNK